MKKIFFIIVNIAIYLFSNIYIFAQDKPTIEWIDIPAGTFIMGSSIDEYKRVYNETQHSVILTEFKISKYEITFAQYDMFCEATGRNKPSDAGWGRANRPVINVSWDDAKAFADWIGASLPTEAQWEYACRAGTLTAYNTGKYISTRQANWNGDYPYNTNIKGDYLEQTLPVGSFKPNEWGIYDMHGNVWEWCSDWDGDYPTEIQTNPSGFAEGFNKICRGGSWFSAARYCRSAFRFCYNPKDIYFNVGFRVVQNPK